MSKKLDATPKGNEAQNEVDQLLDQRADLVTLIGELEAKPATFDLSKGARAAVAGVTADNAQLDAARAMLPEIDRRLAAARAEVLASKDATLQAALVNLRKAETQHERRILAAVEALAVEVDSLRETTVAILRAGGMPHARVTEPIVSINADMVTRFKRSLQVTKYSDQAVIQ